MVQNATPELITIYTDGACHGNPGAGGWGAVLRFRDYEKQIYGGEAGTTNNRMELMAAIEALESIFRPHPVVLHTDSRYVCDGISKWIAGWKANGWKTSTRQPVKNEDLWRRLDAAAGKLDVEWAWVKGHAGIEGNELADALATRGVVEFGGGRERSPSNGSPAAKQRPRGGRRRKRHRP